MYAVGSVNFLFDKSQTPHVHADELCAPFKVSLSTGANKARQFRDLLGTFQFDPRWCLPSLVGDNPLAWMLEIDGLIADVRHMPREVQETACLRGLIPYIPADR